MNLAKLKKENLKEAIEFLEVLNKDLINLKFKNIQGFVTQPDKVSYFDISTEVYKLYDYTEFNSIMCKTYYNVILKQKIEKNELFNVLLSNMNSVYSRSKYSFYDGVFNIFHLVFLKSLRYSKVMDNKFDVNELLKQFLFPFLEKSAHLNDNVQFVVDYINLLREKDIIKTEDFSFKNPNCLDGIINISFEQLVFGGNLNLDNCIIIPEAIDMSVFNYIVSFATNYLVYLFLISMFNFNSTEKQYDDCKIRLFLRGKKKISKYKKFLLDPEINKKYKFHVGYFLEEENNNL